ncbi:MAG: HEAT repeat domain-containing protein [Planctomycetes bacterium]|nr:HEAT repeat domain-containing protein [Planctomycetota bacterium]
MENEEKFVEFVGTASERAGAFASKVVAIGSKIAGFASDGVSAGKEMLGLANEKTEGTSEKKSDATKTAKLKPDIAAVRRKRTKAEKTQSRLESQFKELKAENRSLMSELDQMRSELSKTRSREGTVRARAAALESELDAAQQQLERMQNEDGNTKVGKRTPAGSKAKLESDLAATQRELEEMRDEAKKTQSQLKSKLKDMQAEKESLLSELATVRKDSGEIATRENTLTEQVAALESELAATQRELAETRSQAEKTHSELASQVKDLQAERESLISDLEKARNQAVDERLRADSMEAQIASLKSDIAAFDLESGKTREKESDIDVAPDQTESESSNEEQPSTPLVAEDQISTPADSGSPQTDYQEKLAIVPTVEEIKPSIEAAAAYEESMIENVENVEEPKPEPILEADIEAEEIGPEPMHEVEVAELLEVTAEDVQAADFKNEDDKILFTKAFSDFASPEAASRANAAGIIASIRHELSLRLLVTHMPDEPSAMVRQKCIQALSALEMKEGIGAVECALADEAASVRLAAVWGLYRLAGTESIPALVPMLSDGDVSVRRRAITCIGWLGEQIAKAGNHHRQQAISALIKCLNDPAESIGNAALDTLQTITGKKMPASRTSPERLIEQWQKWWQAELSG